MLVPNADLHARNIKPDIKKGQLKAGPFEFKQFGRLDAPAL